MRWFIWPHVLLKQNKLYIFFQFSAIIFWVTRSELAVKSFFRSWFSPNKIWLFYQRGNKMEQRFLWNFLGTYDVNISKIVAWKNVALSSEFIYKKLLIFSKIRLRMMCVRHQSLQQKKYSFSGKSKIASNLMIY